MQFIYYTVRHCTNHLIRLQFCNLILPVDEKAAERALKHQEFIQKEDVECKPEKVLLMRTWTFTLSKSTLQLILAIGC